MMLDVPLARQDRHVDVGWQPLQRPAQQRASAVYLFKGENFLNCQALPHGLLGTIAASQSDCLSNSTVEPHCSQRMRPRPLPQKPTR